VDGHHNSRLVAQYCAICHKVASGVDYFLLEAEEGVTYTIVVALETLSDIHLHLWRTASRVIELTDVRGLGSTSAELSWCSSFTGPVFVSVESYSDALGSYEIMIEPAP
jgi:hypothetical protein